MTVYGQQQQARAAEERGAYEAALAARNQRQAEYYAEDALARGKVEERTQRDRVRQLIGLRRASGAARGVQIDTGSELDATADIAEIGEIDALTIRNAAEREALGFRTQGVNFLTSGALAQMRARSEAAAARTSSFGTLLSGVSSAAGKYGSYKANKII